MADQLQLFNEHIERLKKDEKDARLKGRNAKLISDFDDLLRTRVPDADMPWREAKRLVDRDPRFIAVTSEIEREDLYRLHMAKRGSSAAAAIAPLDSQARMEV
jgi:hypothetical protein